jgi:surface antigen Omp85-like protein
VKPPTLQHLRIAAVLGLLATPTPGYAQRPTPEPDSTVTVVPGAQYAARGFRRFLLGDHYRDIWTTAIEVPYLDLESFAGGLTPVSSHAGSQTKSLRFAGADGRRYQFRSVFKTPTAGLRPELQGTLVADILQDGASASHPVGALVVAPLLAAVGVLYPAPYLAVMPDDPSLGEFRESFRGVLGIVEERPNEADDGLGGFGEALQVIGPTRLFERIDKSPRDQVSTRSFLTARLVDILIGDRDRHRDNWRWALMDDSGPVRYWEPISRDHDEAFVNADGALVALATEFYPQIVSFGPEYPDPLRLNWHAREVDRRFLVGLDKAVWDSIAGSIQERLTEQVVADAVRRLPEPMYDVGGPALESALLSRLRLLPQEVDRYYRLLAEEVEIHATNAAEIAEITMVDDRYLDVVIRERATGSVPYLRRRFDEEVTKEVRLSMWGGADQVIVRGQGDPDITIRVVGGRGRDVFTDSSASGGVRFYDAGDNTRADLGRSSLDRKPYPEWIGSDLDRYPPREWGSWTRRIPWLTVGPNVGALVGAGIRRTDYGFRKSPFAADWRLRAGISTGTGWGAAEFEGEFRRENSATYLDVEAYVSGIEILNFYGFGNDTKPVPGFDSFKVPMNELWLRPALRTRIGSSLEVGIGPWVRVSGTDSDDYPFFESIADTLYGAGRFNQAGLAGTVEWDSRDRKVASTSGVFLAARGSVAPSLWDVEEVYGSVEGEARTYLTPGVTWMRPTLALRVGGERVFGRAPFHESAFIGGRSTLRGWSRERFAGNASLYGSAELRFRIARFALMLPGDLGLYGLADAARVYVDGESPGGWHTGVGGGLWLSFVDPSKTLTLGFANGEERTAIYFGLGFGF